MAVRTWVGRFCVAEGRVEEEGPWLGSLIRQRPDEEPDELYVLIEPASPASVEYTSQLVDVIAQLYHRDPLSLTGALTRSLRAAHEHLRDWNRKSLKEHQVGAGANCLALRGTDGYLAQAGPGVAYALKADGGFRRIESASQAFDESLGVADRFEPRLTRLALEPGDLVLIASSRLDALAPDALVQRVMERGADDALPELYLLCRDEPNMSLLLLSCFEEEVEAPPEYLRRDPPPGAAGEAGAAVLWAEGGDDTGTSPAVAVMEPPAESGASERPAATLASEAAFDLPHRPIHERVAEITRSTAPPRATGVRIRGDAASPRFKKTTGSAPLPQVRVPKLALLAVAAVVIVGLLAWWQLPGSVQESREERFSTLIAGARADNAGAQTTEDRGLRRQLLTAAQIKLDDAAKIHDDNGELLALQTDVAAALAELDAVYEVNGITPIASLPQVVTGELSVTQSVIGGGNAFLLDAKGGRVLRVALAGGAAPETIFEEGEPAGFVTAAQPVQIAWSEPTQSLLIIDDQRNAFGYFAEGGALPLTVRGAAEWESLDAIAASGGNLYLLDVDSNQVWRYLPGQGGFDSERTGLLNGAVDLSGATEIAVGQDVYVLDAERGIRRFSGRDEAPFPLAGIDRPLMSPASLTVLPGSNRIVVADRGNKRIIVASAEGAFLRQLLSPAFTDLRAVAVDEGTNTLYVLNGDVLMRATFPP